MLPDERIAAADHVADGFAELVGTVRETHRAISARVFASVGESSRPVALAHDAIAEVAYGATRVTGRSLAKLGGRVAARAAGPQAQSLEREAPLRIALGVVSGLWGDRLEARRSPLAAPMAVRDRGRDLVLDRSQLQLAFPAASGRIALFVHGLGETEDAWLLGRERRLPYGERLRDELGFTPVYVRYNSGLHVSENGRRLASLLETLVAEWPVPVVEIALIGHSVGGLVARSACHYGDGSASVARVGSVVMLGTPHTGAALARGVQRLEWVLSRVPETRALARVLGLRSVGIKDLDHGYVTDECWRGQDDGALGRHRAREIPFPEHVRPHYVSASLTAGGDDVVSRTLGDLLVARDSAWGRGGRWERLRFPVEHYLHIGATHHFELLSHPVVGRQLVRWLSAPSPSRLPPAPSREVLLDGAGDSGGDRVLPG